jgi:hypothetical protein
LAAEQLRHMWLDRSASPASKAIYIRNMIRWLVVYHDRVNRGERHPLRKALALIGTICRTHGEESDRRRIRCDPKIEGQWG